MSTKQDKAAKIAATAYPFPSRDSTGDEDTYNERLRNQLANNIRKAIRAETRRCQAIIMEYHRQQLDKPARHQAFVCDDLAELIGQPAKQKARK
jgi:hypothetical protein